MSSHNDEGLNQASGGLPQPFVLGRPGGPIQPPLRAPGDAPAPAKKRAPAASRKTGLAISAEGKTRFAELDALIAQEQTPVPDADPAQKPACSPGPPAPSPPAGVPPPAPAEAGSASGPRTRAVVPAGMRSSIIRYSRKLTRKYPADFARNPKLRKCAAGLFLRELPPKPRRPGRPQQPSVVAAIRLLKQFRREFPDDSKQQRWERIAQAAVPGYAKLPRPKRSEERTKLRARVKSSMRQRRLRRRAKKAKRDCSPPNNS